MPRKDSPMQAQFSQEFPKFKAKIKNFITSTKFKEKSAEYEELFNQMASVAPDDMKHYIEKSPAFLQARNKSLAYMERIVAIHKELEEIFEMDEITLGLKFKYNLNEVDELIGRKVKEAANLVHQFGIVSEEGRKAIEMVDDPFLSQAL